jgi:hypothetical protein
MAIAVILPLSGELMVAKALWQWLIGRKHVHCRHKQFVEPFAKDAGLLGCSPA